MLPLNVGRGRSEGVRVDVDAGGDRDGADRLRVDGRDDCVRVVRGGDRRCRRSWRTCAARTSVVTTSAAAVASMSEPMPGAEAESGVGGGGEGAGAGDRVGRAVVVAGEHLDLLAGARRATATRWTRRSSRRSGRGRRRPRSSRHRRSRRRRHRRRWPRSCRRTRRGRGCRPAGRRAAAQAPTVARAVPS